MLTTDLSRNAKRFVFTFSHVKMAFSKDFPNFDLNISDTETYIPDWGRDSDEELFMQAEIVENKIKESKEKAAKLRFVTLSDDDLNNIVGNAEAQKETQSG